MVPSSFHFTFHLPSLRTTVNPFTCLHLDVLTTVLIIGLFGFTGTCHAFCSQLDRDSLVSFSSNITTSSSPLNWNISVDCCTWEGVTCDINGRVTSLRLSSRGLLGSISLSVANLSHLSELILKGNLLTGNFPDGFFMSLNHLQIIDLSNNRLLGQLPTTDMFPATIEVVDFSWNDFNGTIQPVLLKQAMNLVSFNVSYNRFSGPIPWFICSISPSIRVLDYSDNDFCGTIPQDVGNCSSLVILRAGFNSLFGPLPQDIYRLSTLQELSFPSNRLNGSLSSDIASLNNLRLLDISANELNGIIPPEIGALSNLEQLLLQVNNLNGALPPSLTNCTRLTKLILRVNLLSGDLSKFNFSKLAQLGIIDLGDNFYNGSLPENLFACKSLIAVRLASNQLTGQIPPNIQALKSLSFLSISNNSLTNVTGAVRILTHCRNLRTVILGKNFYNEWLPGDDSLVDSQGFQNLQVLGLGGSLLNGQIPSWLAKLRKLEVLDLSYNELTGSIPSWLGSLPNLFYLDLSENGLSGHFPIELTQLPRLTSQQVAYQVNPSYWELPVFVQPDKVFSSEYNQLSSLPPSICIRSNNLSGNIPTEIGQLKFVRVLNFSDNIFSGNIPSTISDLTNLEELGLSKNQFSGEIPASLGNLFLSSFSVADNDLEGPIPTGGLFDTFPSYSFEGNKGLCGSILQRPCEDQSATKKPSTIFTTGEKIPKEKIIFGFFVGICFGFGFTISTLALRNYAIEGSFLHRMLKKLMMCVHLFQDSCKIERTHKIWE